jgi:hypothetical protein
MTEQKSQKLYKKFMDIIFRFPNSLNPFGQNLAHNTFVSMISYLNFYKLQHKNKFRS